MDFYRFPIHFHPFPAPFQACGAPGVMRGDHVVERVVAATAIAATAALRDVAIGRAWASKALRGLQNLLNTPLLVRIRARMGYAGIPLLYKATII